MLKYLLFLVGAAAVGGLTTISLLAQDDGIRSISPVNESRTAKDGRASGEPKALAASATVKVPTTRAVDHIETYHGTEVADPYRWLEDTYSKETEAWVKAQNEATFGFLEQVPQREAIGKRLKEVWNYERYGLPEKHGEYYFYTYNDGLQNQPVLYVSKSLESDERRVLIDPNTIAADGTTALSDWVASPDGRRLAYSLAAAGSDWNTWQVMDVDSGKTLDEKIEWVKFSSASWTEDGEGFFYSRYDEPAGEAQYSGINYYQKLYYHRVGTPQSEDVLIYQRDDEKEWGFGGEVSDDGEHLVITVWKGTGEENVVYLAPLPGGKVTEATQQPYPLVADFDAAYVFLGSDKPADAPEKVRLYFITDAGADTRQIIALDVDTQQKKVASRRPVVAADEATIETASLLGDQFFVIYLVDATSRVRRFDLSGQLVGEIDLPAVGSVSGFNGDRDTDVTFYSFTNYIVPPSIYQVDLPAGEDASGELWKQPEVSFDPEDFVTEQVFYTSKDGTRIPMILSYRKGMKRDGSNPTILYGYGGFNISVTPRYSPANIVWLEMGGIYAVANLRGGGEYGKAWHEAGMLDRKQTVFDDFIAAAEYLIDEKYTSNKKLAISGRSNGGLLVGATMVQRPDLFGAALPAVGVMDMLRFHKFTIGWAWADEYGSSDVAEQFPALLAYSPYHNIAPETKYPPTLVTTADHDDRVVPGHSFKFAARLQAAQAGDAPILIRIETSAGHGAGTSTQKLIDTAADIYAFLVATLAVESDLQ